MKSDLEFLSDLARRGRLDSCSLVVAGVIVAIFVLITVVIVLVFLLLGGLSSAPSSLFLLPLLTHLLLDLLLVHGVDILGPHHLKLELLLLALSLLLVLQLVGTLNLGAARANFSVGGRFGPLAGCVSLGLASRDGELDERAQTAEQPLLDELGEDNAKLAGRRVDLLAQLVGQGKHDLLELKEDDFDALQVDDMLRDDLPTPLLSELNSLTFEALPLNFLLDFGFLSGHLFIDNGLFSILGQLSDLSLLLLDLFDLGMAGSHALLPLFELTVNGQEQGVLFDVDCELVISQLVLEAAAGRVVTLDDSDELLCVDMSVWAVDQLGLLEESEKVGDLESDVLADAVGRVLPLRKVFEDGAKLGLVLIKDGLTYFELFLFREKMYNIRHLNRFEFF